MKKINFALMLMLFASLHLFAQQDKSADRAELQNLLKERKEKFDSYTESLEKRSGIFGGKTKADMQRSNEVLIEIVKTDNRIMSTLNRVADFRTFEKVNMNYDLMKCSEQLSRLRNAVDTLNKQLSALTQRNEELKNKSGGFMWLTYGLSAAVAVLMVLLTRKRTDA